MANAELLKPFILRWEGGFVDDPLDRGGATNKGITIGTFRQFYGPQATVEELKQLTDKQWLHIFKSGYWDRWKGDQILHQSLANILVDWVWASGVHGIKIPQKILLVAPDGLVGPQTIQALNECNPQQLFFQLRQARLNFVEEIVRKTPSQKRFINGWRNRINEFKF